MHSTLSDDELMRLARAGDENAFVTLYRRRQGSLYRFALRMSGSEAVAEDVTQEVFMTLMRGDGQYAGNDSPFFGLASINLRGIQVGRYMDNVAVMLETEVRWDLAARWTVLGFGGAGWVADAFNEIDDDEAHWAGGAGFRYLIARDYDMRLGIDVARGPGETAVYLQVGNAWFRP